MYPSPSLEVIYPYEDLNLPLTAVAGREISIEQPRDDFDFDDPGERESEACSNAPILVDGSIDNTLPSPGEYNSQEEIRAALRAWAAPRHYAFVIKQSWKTSSGRKKVFFNCDRGAGRKPSLNEAARLRKTSSQRTDCKFSVLAVEGQDRSVWYLKHRTEGGFAEHNHKHSRRPAAHTEHRKLTKEQRLLVQDLSDSGASPSTIMIHLYKDRTVKAIPQDFYNCISEGSRACAQGQSSIQAQYPT